ncbi:restriction endonuclease subunit S [Acinetobacter sp. SwsAc3]|nr:restriction endonuclease subunit S [Acinetobacter sp. SwsAc3]
MTDVKQLITEHLDIWLTAETEKRSGRGRSSGANDTIYGVQKLRELILELAVRGNLNTRNFSDADILSILNLKKEQYELTQNKGWVKTTIGAIYTFVYGDNLPQPQRSNTGEYNVYGSNGIVGTHNEFCIEKPCIVIGRKGSAGALNICENKSWVTDVAYACIPLDPINLKFSYYLLSTCGLDNLGKGIKPGLNRNDAYKVNILIPPLEEQQRIVEKVDELMQLCDQLEQQQTLSSDAHATLVDTLLKALTESSDADDFQGNWQRIVANFDVLFTTEHSIEQLKQTVLQLAVMGKLVKQDPSDEPASELLKKIADEKVKLVKEGKIKKSKPLPEITEDEKPFELPSGWEWVRLDALTSKIGAGSTPKGGKEVYKEQGIPFLRSQNVWNEGLELSDVAFIEEATHEKMSGTKVQANDLLFNITGGSIGRCAHVSSDFDTANVSQHVTIVRCVEESLVPYLHLVLRSSYIQDLVMSVQVGVSREGLSISKLSQFVIPLPPLDEQQKIITKAKEIRQIIQELNSYLSKLQKTKLHLADALVANAVEGV